jgi:phytoene dehydrogenase-like protein
VSKRFINLVFLAALAPSVVFAQTSAAAGAASPSGQIASPTVKPNAQALSPQQRQERRREAFAQRLAQMPPEQRERVLMRLLKRIDSRERRNKMRAAFAYFQSLPAAEQQRLRQKFQSERSQRMQQRAVKREQTRVLLKSLSESQRQVLRQKLQAMDAKGKAAFRDQLIAAPMIERERLLGR